MVLTTEPGSATTWKPKLAESWRSSGADSSTEWLRSTRMSFLPICASLASPRTTSARRVAANDPASQDFLHRLAAPFGTARLHFGLRQDGPTLQIQHEEVGLRPRYA